MRPDQVKQTTDWVRLLLKIAISVLLAGAAFSAVAAMLWPEHWPVWADRLASGAWLAGILLIAGGVLIWNRQR